MQPLALGPNTAIQPVSRMLVALERQRPLPSTPVPFSTVHQRPLKTWLSDATPIRSFIANRSGRRRRSRHRQADVATALDQMLVPVPSRFGNNLATTLAMSAQCGYNAVGRRAVT